MIRVGTLAALVITAAYFASVWLGDSLTLAVVASRMNRVAKRFIGVPEFHYSAVADALSVLLSH